MFNGYKPSHPTGGGLAKWQQDPAGATTPSAQELAGGAVAAQPTGPTSAQSSPGMRALALRSGRQANQTTAPRPAAPPARPAMAPPPLSPPPAAAPPPTALTPPPPAANPFGLHSLSVAEGGGMPNSPGFVSNGEQQARMPTNIDGTALSSAQMAALAGTGLPGDPFTGGFTPNGGWNADNGGRGAADQAAAVAAYKAQYGNPSMTPETVQSMTSNMPDQLEAARRLQQQYQDDVGRFL